MPWIGPLVLLVLVSNAEKVINIQSHLAPSLHPHSETVSFTTLIVLPSPTQSSGKLKEKNSFQDKSTQGKFILAKVTYGKITPVCVTFLLFFLRLPVFCNLRAFW